MTYSYITIFFNSILFDLSLSIWIGYNAEFIRSMGMGCAQRYRMWFMCARKLTQCEANKIKKNEREKENMEKNKKNTHIK